eukprot:gene9626-biopygen4720
MSSSRFKLQGETATSASGPRPFLQILSCAPRPVLVRSASAAVFPSNTDILRITFFHNHMRARLQKIGFLERSSSGRLGSEKSHFPARDRRL